MADTPDFVNCPGLADKDRGLLPLSPFYALHYHFAMLLGVDDFETQQAYHRGKLQLHNAWLHRAGVAWGFGVEVGVKASAGGLKPGPAGSAGAAKSGPAPGVSTGAVKAGPGPGVSAGGVKAGPEPGASPGAARPFPVAEVNAGEVKVRPGLAYDGQGRELHLEADACLHLGQWYDLHKKEVENRAADPNQALFDAHVVIRFKSCLTHQVPAMAEPCQNAATDTAYARVFETIEILLRPGKAPPRTMPYHRLRLLFGLDTPAADDGGVLSADQAVLDRRSEIAALPGDQQPAAWLQAFRLYAALDEIDLSPAQSPDGTESLPFPEGADAVVVLAEITEISLGKSGDAWVLLDARVDNSVRPTHIATTTIQELLCGSLLGASAGGAAAGPRVDPGSVKVPDDRTIQFKVDGDLLGPSVTTGGITVTCLDTKGWHTIGLDSLQVDATNRGVTVKLKTGLGSRLVRLVVRGTGPTPLLGSNNVPLAGSIADPHGPRHDGRDFIYMQKRN